MEGTTPPTVTPPNDTPDGVWTHGPVQLARGRAAKDPHAQTTTYNVASMDDFETSLREYLASPPEQPEHAECQLSFWIGTSFMVSMTPSQQQQQQQQQSSQAPPPPPQPIPQAPQGYQPAAGLDGSYGPANNASMPPPQPAQHISNPSTALAIPPTSGQKTSLSILEALAPTNDPKEKMRKQRAIAKTCVESIQRTDGYRYSFHNCWNSREDDSFRFSYYCNDSLLNKDRAANGKGAKFGKRATKPVYDCRGVLSVKFSAVKQSLDVFYKHIPIHKTYEERAPPPRKDSKRRKFLEVHNPEVLARIEQNRKERPPPDPNAPLKPKRKRPKKNDESQKQTAANSIESDLRAQSLRSLLELIRPDDAPGIIPEEPQPSVQPQPQPQQQQQQPPQPQRRARQVCDMCKVKKTKCDGLHPACKSCDDKGRSCIYSDRTPDEIRQLHPELVNKAPRRQSAQAPRESTGPQPGMSELEKLKAELAAAKSRIGQLEAEKSRPGSEANTPARTTQSDHSNATQQGPPQQMQTQYQPAQAFASYPTMHRPLHGQPVPQPTQSPVNQQLHTPTSAITAGTESDPYNRVGWAPYFGYQPHATMTTQPQPPPQHDQWGHSARTSSIYRAPMN
ncbi:hypothetical protein BU16DRAFT_613194 [Lophium mytilinum]|uniref:Zn(2)-C6 fungal-type domain-containing protein n=1 Tax=Lophium mytilinum TaxID=390894 RepID=A0A6A6R9P4_9PEZI|nr:hypothetical protein BU16DRAFT_613194 [Lophium mytilinum]